MKKGKIVILGALLFSSFALFSCKGNNSSSSSSSTISSSVTSTSNSIVESSSSSSINSSISENLNNPIYSIKITSLSGKPLEGIKVGIYDGNTLVKENITDEKGVISLRLEDKNYDVKLSEIPNGYFLDKDFDLVKGTYEYEVKLSSSVIEDVAPNGTLYQIGDLVYDFTVKTSDGETFTLSDAINDYDAVMINFWYRTCYWCNEEFPFMEEAYQDYKDDIGFIALSHMDTNAAIDDFKYDNELSFPMANDTTQYGLFGVTGCPTTVIIDRYGLLAFVETGAITSKEGFTEVFDKYIGENYVPSMGYGENAGGEGGGEDIDRTPKYEMPSSSEIESIVNGEGFSATYRENEEETNPQFAWPWIISEDGKSIKASNSKVDLTSATIMFDVVIPEGKALAFDYLSSSEKDYDRLFVIIDGSIIHEISGVEKEWKTCFAYISEETRSYEIALCYLKDEEGFSGDDTVYVNNIRLVSNSEINVPTYIHRQASNGLIENNHNYERYVTTVYNEEDGYYHVNSKTGPILLAEVIYSTNWSDELTPFNLASNDAVTINGVNYKKIISDYASYSSNSTVGLTSVTQELKDALVAITNYYGDPNNENEWLEVCSYYNAYGTNGVELSDPIKGLANFNAYEAKLGDQNFATFDRPILPRGLKFKFTVEEAGVYKMNSVGDLETLCWIFGENNEMLAESNVYARKFRNPDIDVANFEIFYYFEPGTNYYITPAFYDYLYFGTLQFNLEYVGPTYELLTLASPGYWTTTEDEEGNMTDELISPGINYVLDKTDGYYHELRDDGSIGSIIYCDFTSIPNIASDSYSLEQLIEIQTTNGTIKYFDFTEFGGKDYTAQMRLYSNKNKIKEGELKGCVPVDETLKEILEEFMDIYAGFEGVEHQWLKTCYYYQYFGPSIA